MEEKIRGATKSALAQLGAGDISFAVEWPANITHGDFAVNAALAAAKSLGRNPREIAEELAGYIRTELGEDAASVSVAGAGFINIMLSREYVALVITTQAQKDSWGAGEINVGKRVVVEYSCPNPFKEMHIGHLMSTVIGEAVSRVVENSGATTIRDSYGGDVGPHVARALWALQKNNVTDVANAAEVDAAYVQGSRAYEESETAKAEIDVLNKEIYLGTNQELMNLWRKSREVCLEAFRELYGVLGTTFDYYFFESETAPIGMEIVQSALAKGIFEESEGAVIYKGEKKGLHTLVFITSKGTPTYETKEVGLAIMKEECCHPDLSLILTAQEQVGHFAVVKAALEEVAPLIGEKTFHVPHGFMRLTSGKMSSREGNTVTARSLLAEVIEKAKERNDDAVVAQQVAVAAIKYMILRQATGGDIVFDPEKSLSLDGDSGPYLQYALVRAQAVLAKTDSKVEDTPAEPYTLERLLIRFPEVAARAERERSPHHIVQYLTEIAGEWNSFYAQERIIGGEYEGYKLAVARAFVATMQRGLWILGIPAPQKM